MIGKMVLRDALRAGSEHLALRADLAENAIRDAAQFMEIATGLTRVQMLAQPNRMLAEEEQGSYFGMVAQRRGGVPVQHLRGSQEFFGRDFIVTPDVLIPRPETEHIVEEVLRLSPDRSAPLRFADVGTGSGILAITLALEFPQSSVVAMDISPAALEIARQNADRFRVDGRVEFVESDLFEALEDDVRFDCVVSNPPYVKTTEAGDLHQQVLDHEPHLALFGGEDGLDVVRRLLPQAAQHLAANGWLLMETGGRTESLDAIMHYDWDARFLRDLQGIERVAVAQNTCGKQPTQRRTHVSPSLFSCGRS